MKRERLEALRRTYRRTLLEDVVPFWLDHALDREEGGYFNCLDRDGAIYSTDKSMLLICRGIWTFSRLYSTMEARADWLAAAESGYAFLVRHLDATNERPALTVTRDGCPLERMFFSVEAYAVMACAEYAIAAGDDTAMERAWSLYHRLTQLYETPGGPQPDEFPRERRGKELVVPVLLFGAARELRRATGDDRCNDAVEMALRDLTSDFLDPTLQMLRESVSVQGGVLPGPRGRFFIPGHSLHASWGLMEEGTKRGWTETVEQGLRLLTASVESGWDRDYGGLLNSVDGQGRPQMQTDWDMKQWWVHNEALYATLLAYQVTGDDGYLDLHERVHRYTYDCFPDCECGEWYGFLHRDGSVAVSAKGTMWKGVFHIASSMWQCLRVLDVLGRSESSIDDAA